MQYRRKIPNVNAMQWKAEQPELVPLWVVIHIELVMNDGVLLMKDRQRVAPSQWVVAEPGLQLQVLDDGDFRDRYEVLKDE
tara:strand:- start:7109 stop:7351 length:243 start_codon:yes stop_codon:yes gene_type:complete